MIKVGGTSTKEYQVPVPGTTPLYPWQEVELEREAPKWAVFADPRLGKTRYALEWLLEVLGRTREQTRALILSPLTPCSVWASEATKMGVHTEPGYRWSNTQVKSWLAKGCNTTLLLNDDKLAPNINELLKWLDGGILIYDESHRLANHSSKRSKAARRLAYKARFVRLLTGTPTPNHAGNLWPQLTCVNPQIWGTAYNKWAQRYLIRHSMYPSVVLGVINEDELQTNILQTASIIRRADVFGPDTWQTIKREVELPPKARATYNTLAKKWVIDSDNSTVDTLITRILRLQQITSGYLPDDTGLHELHRAKIEAILGDLSEIIESEEKVVIFHRFRWEGETIYEAIRNRFGDEAMVHTLNGDTPGPARGALIEDFALEPGPQVAIVQIQAGGVGISLAEATHAMFMSRTFSHVEDTQARDRIYKPRKSRTATYYICPGTVDEYIDAALSDKRNIHDSVMAVDKQVLVFGTRIPDPKRRKLIT